jgi:hypothetical protein
MKISTALLTSAMALAISMGVTSTTVLAGSHSGGGAGMASEVKGKITKIMREGRSVEIGGKVYFNSGSRTNICIKGKCDQDRGALKVGMSCKGMTSSKKKGMEFKKVECE